MVPMVGPNQPGRSPGGGIMGSHAKRHGRRRVRTEWHGAKEFGWPIQDYRMAWECECGIEDNPVHSVHCYACGRRGPFEDVELPSEQRLIND